MYQWIDDDIAAGLPTLLLLGPGYARERVIDHAEIARRRHGRGIAIDEVVESMRIDYGATVAIDDAGRWIDDRRPR